MSALAMILTTAMVVPWDVPGKVSGEMVQEPLNLNGKWEGSLHTKLPDNTDSTMPVTYQDGKLTIVNEAEVAKVLFIDEGKGKCRCRIEEEDSEALLGIYKWQRDQLLLCFNVNGKGRPTNFMVERTKSLLILHRVKPRK